MERKPRHTTPKPAAQVIEEYAHHLASGTLAPAILDGVDYLALLTAKKLDASVAVLINAMETDAAMDVTNAEAAKHRAAQWIRQQCDPSYVPDPPLRDWERQPRSRPP